MEDFVKTKFLNVIVISLKEHKILRPVALGSKTPCDKLCMCTYFTTREWVQEKKQPVQVVKPTGNPPERLS